jgi:hypothetical protein
LEINFGLMHWNVSIDPLMHWNVSIDPEKWPIFGRFLTLFPLKRPARREKNTSNMTEAVGDVMDDVTRKCSIDGCEYINQMIHFIQSVSSQIYGLNMVDSTCLMYM